MKDSEDPRLEKILKWANMPYRKLPLELPEDLQNMIDSGKIDSKKKDLTVLDMYCLSVLAKKLAMGDISLLEQLVGKAGIRQQKGITDKIKDIIPDQVKLLEKYKRDKTVN